MSCKVLPISAGDSAIKIPLDFIFSILSSAPPFPPDIIAPACPILLPGGAVLPAINPTIGFLIFEDLMNSAASSSEDPPISPINKIDSVFLSLKKSSKQSIKLVPLIGSPPIPITVD